ncbi:hypothetical protein GCM10009745_80520 [Kribbella yunnanensis]|uniref:Peptidase inhibitor family I36 protein n=1 Tax=Kribbella yunnanensis TaxID=190194 RepID=A0ABN2J771_9ACTN
MRVVATAAALAAVLPLSSASAVAQGPDTTPARFAAEVRTAGLSADEQQELQRAVNAELAKRGGKQVAANQVRWAGGDATTTIQYPNQRRARALSSSMGVQAGDPSTCAYGNFCVYTGSGYTGNRTDFYHCRDYVFYDDFWSYVNNQTGGTVAVLHLDQPGGPDRTPAAWHGQYTWNGLNYSVIRPCP